MTALLYGTADVPDERRGGDEITQLQQEPVTRACQ